MANETQDKGKKQVLLRLSPELWDSLAKWAEDEYRSINGQIEFLLSESVKRRKRSISRDKQTYEDYANANRLSDEEYKNLLKKYGIEES